MPEIRKLSSEIIGQIAAGEVVERPASAVKELVENSIDAGARNVTVELREGGIQYLRVTDNGRGIPAEQIRMAFERHATSKISAAKDLYDIHTLGFRGEALASIVAVAKVTLTTRTKDAAFGTRAVVEAGEFTDIRQAASPVGTTIVVENLFYNTPVRLKFLKKPSMEASMVADYMLRLILSRPEVAFRFVSQGKTIYHSMGDGSTESALFCLYGRDAFKQMQKVEGHMNGVLLSGYVGGGELARGNRQQQSFFVNGRYFKSAMLSRAVENGCEGRVMIGRFPMCALFLEVNCQQVDVNVHPNKLEVRFQNEAGVSAAVETLVKEALRGDSLSDKLTRQPTAPMEAASPNQQGFTVVSLEEASEASAPKKQAEATTAASGLSASQPKAPVQPEQPARLDFHAPTATPAPAYSAPGLETAFPRMPTAHGNVLRESAAPARIAAQMLTRTKIPPVARTPQEAKWLASPEEAKPLQTPAASPGPPPEPEPEQTVLAGVDQQERPLRLVGIVFDTYWIFEAGERLLLLDQHAAHERMLYDQMMARFEGEHISQRLLSPQLVHLTAREMALIEELTPVLAEAGFEVEPFDDTCVAVHAIPTLFGENEAPRELLLEALDEWQAGRGQVTRERMRKRVAQMACKRAIKGGDRLSDQEVQGFMREMLQSEVMPTCPHGRPIVTEVTRYALEKRFKRVQ